MAIKRHLKLSVIVALLIFFVAFVFFGPESPKNRQVKWGLNFSQSQAEYLGLDWKEAYQATLTELNSKNYRLSAYWNRIEKESGKLDFSELDYMLGEALKNNARVLMAVGGKLPRWPECHYPDWAKDLTEDQLKTRLLDMLEKTVKHLRQYPNIAAWQVENEPFLDFGVCPTLGRDFLEREILLVKSLDNRPVLITESGELSTWLGAARRADLVGISLYRTVHSPYIGRFVYPLTPSFYNRHAQFAKHWAKDVVVTELQAEPWGETPIKEQSLEEQRETFNLDRFQRNIAFAQKTNFSHVYVWGAEYWYYLRQKLADDSLWSYARTVLQLDLGIK